MKTNIPYYKKQVTLLVALTLQTVVSVMVAQTTYTAPAYSTNQNYVSTKTYQKATTTGTATYVGDVVDQVQYVDGLGRPFQTVTVKGSPAKNDMVQPAGYNDIGREDKKYLPYVRTANGAFDPNAIKTTSGVYNGSSQYNYYQGTTGIPSDAIPYAQTIFEPSPLNRVLKQGAPGATWQPTADLTRLASENVVSFDYQANTNGEVILWQVSATGECQQNGSYGAGQLYLTQSTDENKHPVKEYKDKEGHVVLKSVYDGITWLKTYYVYDDYGLLRFVLPPKATEQLAETPDGAGTEIMDQLTYQYTYDRRNRMITKKLPGASVVYMVYDRRDRLVLTQDGEQRKTNKWLFTKYDELNRPVLTGIYDHGAAASGEEMQMAVNTDEAYPRICRSYPCYPVVRNNDVATIGYTDDKFPTTNIEYLTVTYYDTYGFPDSQSFDAANNISDYGDTEGSNTHYFESLTGKVTGSKVKVLGTSIWLNTTNYYDEFYRVIQTVRDLYDGTNGGKEITSTLYDFAGKVLRTKQRQTFGGTPTTLEKWLTYDHAGRLTKTEQEINGANHTITSQMTYNELGQLQKKTLGGVQDENYQYNIRGWLTQINDPDNLGSSMFGMKLLYNGIESGLNTNAQFNGNISGVKWNTSGKSKQGYEYHYDALNRLQYGTHKAPTGSTWDPGNYPYYEVIGDYDKNGNISYLSRNDETGDVKFEADYTYNSTNQLQSIYCWGDGQTYSYTYDLNGNCTYDGLRGFNISYNLLNLPNVISKGTDNLSYIYSATGEKLAKLKNGATQQYYCGNTIYNNAKAVDYILHEEGMVKNSSGSFTYEYYLKDHLGNTRVVFNSSGTIEQSTDYYPFGLAFQNNNLDVNKYLYNGKELQDETLGGTFLGWLDYGARFYDPQIARWHVQDRFAEKCLNLSPYQYATNNPILFIDINGDSTFVTMNKNGTYKVVGGNLAGDDNGIYVIGKDGKPGELIGYSATPESFYFSEEGTWQGTINPNDQSGRVFLNKEIVAKDPSLVDYMPNATGGKPLDFKRTNGTDRPIYITPEEFYRGMPILDKKNGKPIFASARDVGNIAAGIVAGRAGLDWNTARLGLDGLESIQQGRFAIESSSTQYGQRLGFRIGSQMHLKYEVSRLPSYGELRNIQISKDVIKRSDFKPR